MHSDVCDVDGKTVNVHADLFLRCFASIDISMLCVIRLLLVTKWSAAIFFLFGLSRIKRAKKRILNMRDVERRICPSC